MQDFPEYDHDGATPDTAGADGDVSAAEFNARMAKNRRLRAEAEAELKAAKLHLEQVLAAAQASREAREKAAAERPPAKPRSAFHRRLDGVVAKGLLVVIALVAVGLVAGAGFVIWDVVAHPQPDDEMYCEAHANETMGFPLGGSFRNESERDSVVTGEFVQGSVTERWTCLVSQERDGSKDYTIILG